MTNYYDHMIDEYIKGLREKKKNDLLEEEWLRMLLQPNTMVIIRMPYPKNPCLYLNHQWDKKTSNWKCQRCGKRRRARREIDRRSNAKRKRNKRNAVD